MEQRSIKEHVFIVIPYQNRKCFCKTARKCRNLTPFVKVIDNLMKEFEQIGFVVEVNRPDVHNLGTLSKTKNQIGEIEQNVENLEK